MKNLSRQDDDEQAEVQRIVLKEESGSSGGLSAYLNRVKGFTVQGTHLEIFPKLSSLSPRPPTDPMPPKALNSDQDETPKLLLHTAAGFCVICMPDAWSMKSSTV